MNSFSFLFTFFVVFGIVWTLGVWATTAYLVITTHNPLWFLLLLAL